MRELQEVERKAPPARAAQASHTLQQDTDITCPLALLHRATAGPRSTKCPTCRGRRGGLGFLPGGRGPTKRSAARPRKLRPGCAPKPDPLKRPAKEDPSTPAWVRTAWQGHRLGLGSDSTGRGRHLSHGRHQLTGGIREPADERDPAHKATESTVAGSGCPTTGGGSPRELVATKRAGQCKAHSPQGPPSPTGSLSQADHPRAMGSCGVRVRVLQGGCLAPPERSESSTCQGSRKMPEAPAPARPPKPTRKPRAPPLG